MQQVNIAYDYEYDEDTDIVKVTSSVDIIELPEEIVDNIDDYLQKFFDWAADKTNGCFHYDNNLKREVCQIVSSDFVRFIIDECNLPAKVIKVNTDCNPNLPIVEF